MNNPLSLLDMKILAEEVGRKSRSENVKCDKFATARFDHAAFNAVPMQTTRILFQKKAFR